VFVSFDQMLEDVYVLYFIVVLLFLFLTSFLRTIIVFCYWGRQLLYNEILYLISLYFCFCHF